MALPVNDTEEGYDYPDRVRWSLAQDDVKSYQEAAEFPSTRLSSRLAKLRIRSVTTSTEWLDANGSFERRQRSQDL
jgi:hypothetical protein